MEKGSYILDPGLRILPNSKELMAHKNLCLPCPSLQRIRPMWGYVATKWSHAAKSKINGYVHLLGPNA